MWAELTEGADAATFWRRVYALRQEGDPRFVRFIRLPQPGQPQHLFEVFGDGRLHARCCHWTDAMALAALGSMLEPATGFEVTKTTEWSTTNRYRETIATWRRA